MNFRQEFINGEVSVGVDDEGPYLEIAEWDSEQARRLTEQRSDSRVILNPAECLVIGWFLVAIAKAAGAEE